MTCSFFVTLFTDFHDQRVVCHCETHQSQTSDREDRSVGSNSGPDVVLIHLLLPAACLVGSTFWICYKSGQCGGNRKYGRRLSAHLLVRDWILCVVRCGDGISGFHCALGSDISNSLARSSVKVQRVYTYLCVFVCFGAGWNHFATRGFHRARQPKCNHFAQGLYLRDSISMSYRQSVNASCHSSLRSSFSSQNCIISTTSLPTQLS